MLAALALSLQMPKIVIPAVETRAELRLTVDHPSVAKDEDPGYHATIRNTGRRTLRLIEPQDGSESAMRNPSLTWRLPDLKHPEPIMRCGNTNEIEESAFFTLAPGESRAIGIGWAAETQLSSGSNRVSLIYDIAANRKDLGFSGVMYVGGTPPEIQAAQARVAALYSALTPIHLTSNVVRVTLKAAP